MKRVSVILSFLFLFSQAAGAAVVVTWLEVPLGVHPSSYDYPADVQLDMNADGISDFRFSALSIWGLVRTEGGNQLVIPEPLPFYPWIKPLYPDYEIGSELKDGFFWGEDMSGFIWKSDYVPMSPLDVELGGLFYGYFVGHQAYLGVALDLDDGLHYGWINIRVKSLKTIEIFGWAYETEVGKSIFAGAGVVPEPSTVALLALGGTVLAWRRKRSI